MKNSLLILALSIAWAQANPSPDLPDLPHTDSPEAAASAYLNALFRDSHAAMQYLYIDDKRLAQGIQQRDNAIAGGWGSTPPPYPLFTLPKLPPDGSAADAQALRDSYARALSPYLCSDSKHSYCFMPDTITVHRVLNHPENSETWFDDSHLPKTAVQMLITGRVNGEVQTPHTVVWLTPTANGWRVLGHDTTYWGGDEW